MNKFVIVLILLCLAFGCRTTKEMANETGTVIFPAEAQGNSLPDSRYAVFKMYFGTNRNLTTEQKPNTWLGTERSNLKYGTCQVSIPRHIHQMGELERPSIWKLEFQEDTTKHIVLRKVIIMPKNKLLTELNNELVDKPKKDAFIFVHGYNVSFADAALTTAQLSYDLGFGGVPVFYSWPSKETLEGYMADEATARWAQTQLELFLTDFIAKSDLKNIHFIAHSMGNLPMTNAIASVIEKDPSFKERISEIILAAPDIDKDEFKDDIVKRLVKVGKRVTIYVSSTDKALIIAKELRGGVARVGDPSQGILVVPGLETIDATSVNTSLIGHSYIRDTGKVLSDIHLVIRDHKKPSDRPFLSPVPKQSAAYWKFKK